MTSPRNKTEIADVVLSLFSGACVLGILFIWSFFTDIGSIKLSEITLGQIGYFILAVIGSIILAGFAWFFGNLAKAPHDTEENSK